jgi:hypothetical protein
LIKNNYRDFVGLVLTDRVSEEATLFEFVTEIVLLVEEIGLFVLAIDDVTEPDQLFVRDAK